MFSRWLVSLTCAGLAYSVSSYEHEQIPFGSERAGGPSVLKRYARSSLLDRDLQDVLREPEASDAHVWQVGPSHVDVIFQHSEGHLNQSFADAGSVILDTFDVLHGYSGRGNIGSLANSTYHSVYHPLYEIEDFVGELARTYPDLVQLVNLGHTAQGREMFAVQLSRKADEMKRSSVVKKTGFVITGAQHAREWIATSTALYLAHALVADDAEDFALSSWLDYFDFYIIPVPNPDGYVYTWENDRLWYKNRQIVGPAEKCVGVDMNRNWGHKWKSRSKLPSLVEDTDDTVSTTESEADPCSPWYPGHRPFESPEVNNIANFITTLPALNTYVDLRSYGQMVSTPFSYSCKKVPKDAENQLEAALGAVNAIKQVHGTPFTTGSLCHQLYKASGNVVDYMYAKAGIKFSYSVHLRDTGTYGFSLPAEWIRPVGEETASMIRFLAGFISGRNKKDSWRSLLATTTLFARCRMYL
ncbi:hypothetical protein C8Q78DRAFT_1143469 [Trametes maxima]|nr:hypothetical protein C8Q78DRAFT_1143469 [Trametes maxima]